METIDDSLKVTNRLHSLKKEFEKSFHPNSPTRVWLISSITRNIEAYGLIDIDAWEVLTDAYIRAVKFVTKGGLIWNLISWLKSASVRIIYEHRRKFYRLDTTSIPEMDWFSPRIFSISTEAMDAEALTDSLRSALEILSQIDRDLLLWRVNDEFSWEKIQQLLIERGESPSSCQALRQRKHRAIGKLKRAFLATQAARARTNKNLSEEEFEAVCNSFKKLKTSRAVIK